MEATVTATERHKASPAGLAESVFDIAYLTFDLVAAIVFATQAQGRTVFWLLALLSLVLGAGDAFHLVPRVVRELRGTDEHTEARLGLGLQVSSITMTAFYVILYHIWRTLFPQVEISPVVPAIVWVSALARIAICLLPQNNWLHAEGNPRLSLLRNSIFAVTGIVMVALFLLSGDTGGHGLWRMAIAITISFACYVPVTLWGHSNPKVGMLMIPKTCAYVWMVAMGLQLLGQLA